MLKTCKLFFESCKNKLYDTSKIIFFIEKKCKTQLSTYSTDTPVYTEQ